MFDPAAGETLSSDVGHAAALTLANAASFVPKISGDTDVHPVAFACIKVERRS